MERWLQKVIDIDLYAVLGLSGSASQEEIKTSYRKLVLKDHPDKNPNDKEAAERFIKYAIAWEVLGDPNKKQIYDSVRSAKVKGNTWARTNTGTSSSHRPADSTNKKDNNTYNNSSKKRERTRSGPEYGSKEWEEYHEERRKKEKEEEEIKIKIKQKIVQNISMWCNSVKDTYSMDSGSSIHDQCIKRILKTLFNKLKDDHSYIQSMYESFETEPENVIKYYEDFYNRLDKKLDMLYAEQGIKKTLESLRKIIVRRETPFDTQTLFGRILYYSAPMYDYKFIDYIRIPALTIIKEAELFEERAQPKSESMIEKIKRKIFAKGERA